MAAVDAAHLNKALPANPDAERLLLGAVLLEPDRFVLVAGDLEEKDFSSDAHRRIFRAIEELHGRGIDADRISLADALMSSGQLDAVGGLAYLVSLDEGMPRLVNIEQYVRLVKEKSMLRQIIFSAQKTLDSAYLGADDPETIIASANENLVQLAGGGRAKDGLMNPGEVVESIGIDKFLDPSNRVRGVPTAFLKFDEMTGGFRPGELIILAARPAMGKTAFALNIAANVVAGVKDEPKTVAVFSLEMSRESLLTRMICSDARVDQHSFRTGFLDGESRRKLAEATQRMSESKLFIDDSSTLTLMELNSKLRQLKVRHGLDMVIVDYLQLMQSRGNFDSRTQEVSALSRGLKLLSKELECPFLVLSQLSRAPEQRQGDHRPQLSDLRESGSIEQDADMVCFLFREEVYNPTKSDLKGKAELIISKQRNGPIGKVPLVFLHKFTRFENPADDIYNSDPMGQG
jgi:replicative DNA helicase